MAIAFDAFSDGVNFTESSPLTWTHTCTGSDRLLIVGTVGDTASDTVSGVTYNSVAMTKIAAVLVPDNRYLTLWYLLNPASGANTVSVTSAGPAGAAGRSTSYTGVQQSGQPDASTTNTVSANTTLTTTLTTIADNCWTMLVAKATVATLGAGTGSTARTAVTEQLALFDNNAAITPAGSTSMTVTFGSGNCGTVMASFSPVAAAVTARPRHLTLLGVT